MSPEGRQWFLFNASPDLRAQLESCPALQPRGLRDSPVQAVLLTDAELDHTLGLLLLREAGRVELHATPAVHETLCTGTGLLRTLGSYTHVAWRPVAPGTDVSLAEAVSYRAFSVPTTKGATDAVVGYRITNAHSGRAVVYLPGVEALTAPVRAELEGCSCLLVDGTCWRDDELIRLGVAGRTSREMGHVPIAAAGGSLERLSSLSEARRVYVHVNNTNPILLEDSPERRIVEEHGFEVAEDGLELEL